MIITIHKYLHKTSQPEYKLLEKDEFDDLIADAICEIQQISGDNAQQIYDECIREMVYAYYDIRKKVDTRNRNDYNREIMIEIESVASGVMFNCDRLNLHPSQTLVDWLRNVNGITDEMGIMYAVTSCMEKTTALQQPDQPHVKTTPKEALDKVDEISELLQWELDWFDTYKGMSDEEENQDFRIRNIKSVADWLDEVATFTINTNDKKIAERIYELHTDIQELVSKAMEYNVDVWNTPEYFINVNEAYQIISDVSDYVLGKSIPNIYQTTHGEPQHEQPDAEATPQQNEQPEQPEVSNAEPQQSQPLAKYKYNGRKVNKLYNALIKHKAIDNSITSQTFINCIQSGDMTPIITKASTKQTKFKLATAIIYTFIYTDDKEQWKQDVLNNWNKAKGTQIEWYDLTKHGNDYDKFWKELKDIIGI